MREGTGVIANRDSDTRAQLGGDRGIHVEQSVTIGRAIHDVYRFWRDFENLPRFMRHLKSVAVRGEGISHGEESNQTVKEDLERFRQLMEGT